MKWILLATVAVVTLALAPVSHADTAYRWVDADGETQYSPVPPKDPDMPYVMLRDGVVVERYNGGERLERPEQERAEQRRAAEAERKADALLLIQYRDAEAIDLAMEAELDNLRYDVNLLDGTFKSLRQSLFQKISLAADRQRAGLNVAETQTEQINGLQKRMDANRVAREELKERESKIRNEYSAKKERYRVLKAGTTAP